MSAVYSVEHLDELLHQDRSVQGVTVFLGILLPRHRVVVVMVPSTPSPKVIKMREIASPFENSPACQQTFHVKDLCPNHYETTSGAVGLFHNQPGTIDQTATRSRFGGHTPSDYHLRASPSSSSSSFASPSSPFSPSSSFPPSSVAFGSSFPRLSEGTQGHMMKATTVMWEEM